MRTRWLAVVLVLAGCSALGPDVNLNGAQPGGSDAGSRDAGGGQPPQTGGPPDAGVPVNPCAACVAPNTCVSGACLPPVSATLNYYRTVGNIYGCQSNEGWAPCAVAKSIPVGSWAALLQHYTACSVTGAPPGPVTIDCRTSQGCTTHAVNCYQPGTGIPGTTYNVTCGLVYGAYDGYFGSACDWAP